MERQVSGKTTSQTGQTSRDQAAKADLMHATADVAVGQPLNLLPGLDEQAAVGDADRHAAAVLQPHRQAGEARLAMDGQKVQVIVVPGIASSWRAEPVNIHACMPIRPCELAADHRVTDDGHDERMHTAKYCIVTGCCLSLS